MNKSALYLSLLLLAACGGQVTKENNSGNSGTKSVDSVGTVFVESKDIACNYKDGVLQTDTLNTDDAIINGVQQTKFDIIFPKNLSYKIINELKNYVVKNQKITVTNFWSVLSVSGKKALNDYLIKNYGTSNDNSFNLKRRLTAYAFSIFIENENYQQAIRLKTTSSKQFKDFTVAFSYDIRERIDLRVCNDEELDIISVPTNLLMPSDIITNAVCKDFYEKNIVSIQIHKDQNVYLTLETDRILDNVIIPLSDLKIKNNRNYKMLNFNNDDYKIYLEIKKNKENNAYYDRQLRSFVYDTIEYLNLDYTKEGHSITKLIRLDCYVTKPFKI